MSSYEYLPLKLSKEHCHCIPVTVTTQTTWRLRKRIHTNITQNQPVWTRCAVCQAMQTVRRFTVSLTDTIQCVTRKLTSYSISHGWWMVPWCVSSSLWPDACPIVPCCCGVGWWRPEGCGVARCYNNNKLKIMHICHIHLFSFVIFFFFIYLVKIRFMSHSISPYLERSEGSTLDNRNRASRAATALFPSPRKAPAAVPDFCDAFFSYTSRRYWPLNVWSFFIMISGVIRMGRLTNFYRVFIFLWFVGIFYFIIIINFLSK